MRVWLVLLGVLAVVAGLGAGAVVWTSDMAPVAPLLAIEIVAVGWIAIAVGWISAVRWGLRRTGLLTILLGFAIMAVAGQYSDRAWVYTITLCLAASGIALYLHLALAVPSGRVGSRREAVFVAAAYAVFVGLYVLLALLATPKSLGCSDCPESKLLVTHNPSVNELAVTAVSLASIVALLIGTWFVLQRLRGMDALPRHLFLPLAATVIATNVVLLVVFTLLALRPPEDSTSVPLSVFCVGVVIFLALAVRQRRRRRREVSEFVVELARGAGAGGVRDALAEAAGDPSLELAYWRSRPEGWVDLAGQAVALPESGRLVTIAHYRGRPSAAVICDPVLGMQAGVLDAALSAVSLSLENERLQAELRAHVDELRESRMRIATASDAERLRVGRDLHDGAQQRLIAIKLMLDAFAARVERGESLSADEFSRAGDELESVVEEIRAVSAGLNPPVLAERGLASALEFAASRSPVPVRLLIDLPIDPPDPARSAVYFMVTELLTNVAKHSAASTVMVAVAAVDGELELEVWDDGVGGAEPRPGSGLVGLADRAEALGGSLTITGLNGGGTQVQARVPIAE